MRPALAFLTLLAIGCSDPAPVAPKLRYGGTSAIPDKYPLLFALRLINEGNAPALVNDVSFEVESSTLLRDDDGKTPPPNGFNCRVSLLGDKPGDDGNLHELTPGETISIPPGEERVINGAVQWLVAPGPRPMLAIVRGRFVPLHDGKKVVETQSQILVLESVEGATALVRDATTTGPGQARQVFDALNAVKGTRSPAFEELLDGIEAVANRNP